MSDNENYPILEFDPTRIAFIEPQYIIRPIENIPTRAVLCFFQDVITRLAQHHQAKIIKSLRSEIGTFPVYKLEMEGQRLVVCHPGVGAPLAAGLFEELIALGCRKFIACGGAGVLDNGLALGHVIVPATAVRDEGTSYHYLPPSREVAASPNAVAAIQKVLIKHQVEYIVGKTWTTDAMYRETPAKIQRRRAEGCIAVEMEAAAFFAVAQFRGVEFGQLLYGGDNLGGENWDGRDWTAHSGREKLFWLAAEACLNL